MERKLMPSLTAEIHQGEGEIKEAAYRAGHPRQYRFDAGKGRINLNGEENLTKAGEDFTIRPVAVRIFKDNLFDSGKKLWAELFFLNEMNQVCCIMTHGYTVENLERLESDLYYDELDITEVELTLKPKEKQSKQTDDKGKNFKFYIGEWSYKPAKRDLIEIQNIAVEGLKIWRADTFRDTADELVALNFSPPAAYLAEAEEVKAEAAGTEA